MASRSAVLALHNYSQALRSGPQQACAWFSLHKGRGFGDRVDTNAPPGESRQGDYNTQEEAQKEDFIATPLPEVPREVRDDPKTFPHQTNKQRREDMDVPDEGEAIPKTPGGADDPSAAPELGGSKRFYSTGPAFAAFRRSLNASAALWDAGKKHPDAQRAQDLAGPQTDSDPTAGTLGGDTSYMNPEVQDQAAKDPSLLHDPEKLQERRRAKDPQNYDKVHPGNPWQQAEQTAHAATQNAHAARRKGDESTFTADAERAPSGA